MSSFAVLKNSFNSLGSSLLVLRNVINNIGFRFNTDSTTQKLIKGVIKQPKTHPYPFRDKTRCYFPRPKETKRIGVHGWDTRMETNGGRRVLMRRILKGRHVISH